MTNRQEIARQFTHITEDGHLEKRGSKTKDYRFVVVGFGKPYGEDKPGFFVLRWSETEKAAARATREMARYGYTQVKVEAINGGVR